MSTKRYAILRVDNRCPDFFCKYKVMKDEKSFSCNNCNLHRKYGDTKEQLINKVTQVINDFIIPHQLRNAFEKETLLKNYDLHKKLAKEIIEFLGVK